MRSNIMVIAPVVYQPLSLTTPKPFDVHATINTSQITSIIDCGRRNSNDEIVRHRTIVLSSGEIFLTLTPYNEILDKIKGKPKK